ncbi:MAG: aminotransferase class I/II-fold pyridoxal phosphate-dependent enzyme [Bacteroidales bacterium]|nr:aminotransferase class I/II-fold pyridoxal phosphate-dependent enzyme [Bacteroidales bacterium]MDD4670819.1 aminotransferase class I/II-fold pyridoxal phosphate-dependent enzyme [Bacteroidales bacterium]
MKETLKTDSILVHGAEIEDNYGAAVTPIYQSSTFKFRSAEHGAACFAGEEDGFIYTRIGNPTIKALETTIAQLENGCGCVVVSSGMAAVNSVYAALLKGGDHMISTDAVYGPSRVVMEKYWSTYGVESTYLDTTDLSNIEKAIRPNTKVLYIESPSNPTIAITDIAAAAKIAHAHGIKVVVDNTFCSPILQKPLDLGADVVLHSMTKFLNGHADIVAGAVISKTKEIDACVRAAMVNFGFNMDPTQAYMVIRGIKTLSIRVLKQQENAIELARWLENHPKVEWVKYPGLPSHPQYELAKRQMAGPGSLISFSLKGGIEAGKTLMNNIRMVLLAVSLGGVESLMSHPASMTHSKMSKEAREACGITDGLVRFAVGIEDVEDIRKDLEQALDKI